MSSSHSAQAQSGERTAPGTKQSHFMERDTQAGSQRLTGCDFLTNLAEQVEPAGLRTGFRACFLLSLPTLSLLAGPAFSKPRAQPPSCQPWPTWPGVHSCSPASRCPGSLLNAGPSSPFTNPLPAFLLPLPLPGPSAPGWQGGCGGAGAHQLRYLNLWSE